MNEQDDMDSAGHEQMLNEQRRREDELLARAPAAHRELESIRLAAEANLKAINWALDRIFRG